MRIISGQARGRTILTPPGNATRPTLDRVRENLFNMLQGRVAGARVLDLFAGSGALSLEAISRGAAQAVLADRDRKACAVQHRNISALSFEEQTRVLCCDWRRATELLTKEEARFDLVFLDPPYAMADEELQAVFDSLRAIVFPGTTAVLEHAARRCFQPAGWTLAKQRAWGYCGVSLFLPPDD